MTNIDRWPEAFQDGIPKEGLSIPPQTGTRHEWWEKMARVDEANGLPASAKTARIEAAALVKADLAYDLEADAIRSNRVVRKAALKEMGAGDLACFKLRNLREFEAVKSAEHALYFWWAQ